MQYSIDERFNLDRNAEGWDTCFRQNDKCAEEFLYKHVNKQMFNEDSENVLEISKQNPRIAY